MKNKVLLIDGSSYLYRAYYALPPLTVPDGRPTGAVYGFIRMLLKTLSAFNTPYVAVAFDLPGKTLRHEKFSEYKATRKETPDPLKQQIPILKKIIQLLGIKILEIPSYEADDIIATLSKKAEIEDYEAIIVTPDKDMNQLISDNIKIFNPVKEELLDKEKIKEKYGIYPQQFIDYLTMIGDAVDNIPGIKGIGPKTATALLQEFGSLENILENVDKLKGKLKESFKELDKEQLQRMKEIIKLDANIEINTKIDDLKKSKPDLEKLKQIFQELGFKSLLKDVEKSNLKIKEEKIEQKSLF